MAGMSNYLQNKLIDHIFRNTAFAVPTGIYIGLFTTIPTAAWIAGSPTGVECTYGNYARATIAPTAGAPTNWTNTSAGTIVPPSTGTTGTTSNYLGTGSFGTGSVSSGGTIVVNSFAIFDALTGGNMLFFGSLGTNKTINVGDPVPIIQTGGIQITVGS